MSEFDGYKFDASKYTKIRSKVRLTRTEEIEALQSDLRTLAEAVVALDGYVQKLANPKLQTALTETAARFTLDKHAPAITLAQGILEEKE